MEFDPFNYRAGIKYIYMYSNSTLFFRPQRRTHFMIPHLVTDGIHWLATLVCICIKSYMFIKYSASYTAEEYGVAQDELMGAILAFGKK